MSIKALILVLSILAIGVKGGLVEELISSLPQSQ